MTQAVTESAARTEAVMVRQNGERIVHFDPGTGVVCPVGKQGIDDPRATTCGRCQRTDVWRQAWKDEARKVKAP
jgi:hypothetical protein